MEPKTLITKPSADYELIDSGNGEKLERYGKYILRRPDPQALWDKTLPEKDWKVADATFDAERKVWIKKNINNKEAKPPKGEREVRLQIPNEWQISFDNLKFNIKPTAFKHTGVFPEQSSNWSWTMEKIKQANRPVKILNLFGYTGGATLAALFAGAEIVHVDGSKSAITWAKENAELSGLINKPVRWIIDDAKKFVMREIKRGVKYDGIIMDPPSFGRGAKGEIWKIENDLLPLLKECAKILSDNPIFFLINGYASGYSSQAYYNALKQIMGKYNGNFEFGELAIEARAGNLLPCGIFARWFR